MTSAIACVRGDYRAQIIQVVVQLGMQVRDMLLPLVRGKLPEFAIQICTIFGITVWASTSKQRECSMGLGQAHARKSTQCQALSFCCTFGFGSPCNVV